jgi:hypothetical protein
MDSVSDSEVSRSEAWVEWFEADERERVDAVVAERAER